MKQRYTIARGECDRAKIQDNKEASVTEQNTTTYFGILIQPFQ